MLAYIGNVSWAMNGIYLNLITVNANLFIFFPFSLKLLFIVYKILYSIFIRWLHIYRCFLIAHISNYLRLTMFFFFLRDAVTSEFLVLSYREQKNGSAVFAWGVDTCPFIRNVSFSVVPILFFPIRLDTDTWAQSSRRYRVPVWYYGVKKTTAKLLRRYKAPKHMAFYAW